MLSRAKKLRNKTFIEGLRIDQYFHEGYTLDSMPDQSEISADFFENLLDRCFGTAQPQHKYIPPIATLPLSHTFKELEGRIKYFKLIPSVIKMLNRLRAFTSRDSEMTKCRFATLYTAAIVQTCSFNDEAVSLKANHKERWTDPKYANCVRAAQDHCPDAIALTGYCMPRPTPPEHKKSTKAEVLFFKILWKLVFGKTLDITCTSGMPSLWIYLCSTIANQRGWSWPWQQTPKELLPAIPGRSYIAAILNVSQCYRSFNIMENIFKQMEYTLWEYVQHFMLSGKLGHPAERGGRDKLATNQQLAEIYSFFKQTGETITVAGGPMCFRLGLPELPIRSRNHSLRSLRFMIKRVADEVVHITSKARKGYGFNWAEDFRGGIWVVAERYFNTLEDPTKIFQFLRSGTLCANDHFLTRFEEKSIIFSGTLEGYKEQLEKQFSGELYELLEDRIQDWILSNRSLPHIIDRKVF